MSIMTRRIHVPALALAGGVVGAIALSGMAVWALVSNQEPLILAYLSQVCPNYAATAAGACWGALFGFVAMFTELFLFGLVYNLVAGEPRPR